MKNHPKIMEVNHTGHDERVEFLDLEALKGVRDSIVCNPIEKIKIYEDGVISKMQCFENREMFVLNLEILAILANFTNIESLNYLETQKQKIETVNGKSNFEIRKIDSTIKKDVAAKFSDLFPYFNIHTSEFDLLTVSLFRSLRLILKNILLENIDGSLIKLLYRPFEIQSSDDFLIESKKEIIKIFIFLIDNYGLKETLKNKKFIEEIDHPSLDSIVLIDKLMDKDTFKHFKINKLIKKIENFNWDYKRGIMSASVKWYMYNETANGLYRNKLLDLFKEQIKYDRKSYLLLGKMVEDDLKAQLYCKDIGLLSIIDSRVDNNQLSTEVIFCLYALASKLEENRKIIAKTRMVAIFFDRLTAKIQEEIYDEEFIGILYFLKAMTRSILFLRSDLLDFPIVDLLLLALKKLNKKEDINIPNFSLEDKVKRNWEVVGYPPGFRQQSSSEFDHTNSSDGIANFNYSESFERIFSVSGEDENALKEEQEIDFSKESSESCIANFSFKTSSSESTLQSLSEKSSTEETSLIIENSYNLLSDGNNSTYPVVKSEIFDREITKDFLVEGILNIFCNLVFEYGNYKESFIELHGIKLVLNFTKTHPKIILTLFKNFLYNTVWKTKAIFIKSSDKNFFSIFYDIFEKTKDLDLLQLVFNLKRNLVCDDSLDSTIFTYDDFFDPIFKYLTYFAIKGTITSNSIEEKVLIQLFYTIGNLSANSEKFKNLIIRKDYIDSIMKLSVTRELQLSAIWIIINITWKDSGFENRVEILNTYNVREWLLTIRSSDPIVIDKIETALENLK